MKNKIILLLSTLLSFGCFGRDVSLLYRRLVEDACCSLGISGDDICSIRSTNKESILACYYPDQKYIVVNESKMNCLPYGAKRLTIFHEVFHHKQFEDSEYGKILNQDLYGSLEEEADLEGAGSGRCYLCTSDCLSLINDFDMKREGYALPHDILKVQNKQFNSGLLCPFHTKFLDLQVKNPMLRISGSMKEFVQMALELDVAQGVLSLVMAIVPY